jgi:2-polyprenyl-3-methyl-5-hydroxy-6-metoxy-1,4-benzoquinol methylase
LRKSIDKSSPSDAIYSPFGHSRASSRYENRRLKPWGVCDRNFALLNWIGSGKRVLEVGCSTGYMSQELVERGCNVTGIEVDPIAAEKAREYCETVHVLDLNAPNWLAALPERSFDIVLLGDVLEHLISPDTTLRDLAEILSADGSLVISLPNVVHWITRFKILFGQFNYEPWGTLDHTHLRFFTKKTAYRLIESSGFRITRFHPVSGGKFAGRFRPVWQQLAYLLPGLFCYQMLFEAKKRGAEYRAKRT